MSQELLTRILDSNVEIQRAIAEIQVDIKYHIKRTDLLEVEVENLKKKSYKWQGALIALGILGTILGIVNGLKILLIK